MPSRSHTHSPMPHSPDITGIQKVVRTALQNPRATVQHIERLPSRLHRLYNIHLGDGSQLVLSVPPGPSTRVLGHEHRSIETEARVLDLLAAQTQVPCARKLRYEPGSSSPLNHQAYLLRSWLHGVSLASLAPSLSPAHRASIDRWLGHHLRSVSHVTAPRFGRLQRAFSGSGHASWREAFLSLFESVLRDAEDSLVSLPYDSIRSQLAQRAAVLDDIRTPQLVALDAGADDAVLIDSVTGHISGLLRFENVVWGDPMLASWAANASGAFWDGWGSCPSRIGREKTRMQL